MEIGSILKKKIGSTREPVFNNRIQGKGRSPRRGSSSPQRRPSLNSKGSGKGKGEISFYPPKGVPWQPQGTSKGSFARSPSPKRKGSGKGKQKGGKPSKGGKNNSPKPKDLPRCNMCQEVGHFLRNCPNKNRYAKTKCRICNGANHPASCCPGVQDKKLKKS